MMRSLPFVLLLLAACGPTTPAATPNPARPEASVAPEIAPPRITPTTAAACTSAGGTWRREGMIGQEMCIFTYADAGKRCTSGSECLGDCRAEGAAAPSGAVEGRCQATSSPFGCYSNVEQGQVSGGMCVD